MIKRKNQEEALVFNVIFNIKISINAVNKKLVLDLSFEK